MSSLPSTLFRDDRDRHLLRTFSAATPLLILCVSISKTSSITQWHSVAPLNILSILSCSAYHLASQGEISNPIPHFVLISRFSHLEKARIFSQRKTEERRREKERERESRGAHSLSKQAVRNDNDDGDKEEEYGGSGSGRGRRGGR